MINFNGDLLQEANISHSNRGLAYGDCLFETIKTVAGKVLFLEDHYFRLMSSMRILRMEIPMHFTMEFMEAEILKTIEVSSINAPSYRIKIIVVRKQGGYYKPTDNNIDYIIESTPLKTSFYTIDEAFCEVELFKDHFVQPGLMSNLKTNSRLINVLGSIYAQENDFDNCLLLNQNKMVVEALEGNLFLIKDNLIKTPPLGDGCIKGVMRKQIINVLEQMPEYNIEEASISPFELQNADEMFISNVIKGIKPISKYRKKRYTAEKAKTILAKLNEKILEA